MQLQQTLHTLVPDAHLWRSLANHGTRTTVWLAYWLAVLIPLAYLLVLPASALELVDVQTVLVMALVHALAVCLGHRHDPR